MLLLEAGADPNVRGRYGYTVLHEAVRNEDSTLTQALLDAGADPKERDDDGKTPLDFAEDAGNTPAVELLGDAAPR